MCGLGLIQIILCYFLTSDHQLTAGWSTGSIDAHIRLVVDMLTVQYTIHVHISKVQQVRIVRHK